MNRVASSLATLLLVSLSAAPASAYVREQSNWNPGTLPIHYFVNQSSIPSSLGVSAGVAAVEAGYATWAGPSCTSWRAADSGNTSTAANTGDGVNVIEWVSGSWPSELGDYRTVIGITTPVWNVGGYFVDADIRFNNVGFNWIVGPGGGGNVDTQSIATHEEGHFLGLGHTTTNGAIMYPAYSGGLVRNLSSDDQSGVCAIYPSGVAATDAGVAMGSDPCNSLGNTCATCTPNNNCGFCTANGMCMTGTQSAPTMGSCAGGYVWFPNQCGAAGVDAGSGGTGRFGDPCASPNDCGSGGLCVHSSAGGAGFCSRACTDDCSCPDAYACVSAGTVSVCAPGTRTCSTPANDAAVVPGNDAALPPGTDGGVVVMRDAASPTDDGGAERGRTHASCGCVAAGTGSSGAGMSVLALVAIGLVFARRRRR